MIELCETWKGGLGGAVKQRFDRLEMKGTATFDMKAFSAFDLALISTDLSSASILDHTTSFNFFWN